MRHEELIAEEVRADGIVEDLEPDLSEDWEIDGASVTIAIRRLERAEAD